MKWDAHRITENRVFALMGQQSTEIRSLDKGGVVSTAARAGVMVHKLGEKRWGAVLAHATQYQVEGTNIRNSLVNLKGEFGVKSSALTRT